MKKTYTLLDEHGEPYQSPEKGLLGVQPRHRVFFKDEAVAIAAGYRPCGACLREKYAEWKRTGASVRPTIM